VLCCKKTQFTTQFLTKKQNAHLTSYDIEKIALRRIMSLNTIPSQYLSAFREFIATKVHLTDAEWQRIQQSLALMHLPANTLLLKEGQICSALYFVNQGFLRFFVVGENGKDTTKFFTPEHQLFTSQQSFSTQTPARENIEALEDSSLLVLSHTALQTVYEEVPQWHTFIRRLLQEVNVMTEELYMESITITAEERYRKMLQEEPHIALRTPLKHIASYLGVTPESLSRIRKKISEGA
jgi:CRP-like cAMP-binding protein